MVPGGTLYYMYKKAYVFFSTSSSRCSPHYMHSLNQPFLRIFSLLLGFPSSCLKKKKKTVQVDMIDSSRIYFCEKAGFGGSDVLHLGSLQVIERAACGSLHDRLCHFFFITLDHK